jgi:23S rRNA (cytosine1962-C5)-methyltransferase
MPHNIPRLILNPSKVDIFERRHPWLFTGAVLRAEGKLHEGDVVHIALPNGKILATAHYQADGSIAARLLAWDECAIDTDFWVARLSNALQCRRAVGLLNHPQTNTFRLVHGEGDGLPGLIIDFYNGTAVLQAHSGGMWLARHDIAQALKIVMGEQLQAVYDKSAETLAAGSGLKPENGYLLGNGEGNCRVQENGLSFKVNWQTGQKTGFFIDQRDNRRLVGQYAPDKRVLNTFCYTGGFSVYALQAGATLVHSVDSSAKAIALTDENVALHQHHTERHQSYVEDTLKFLQQSPKNAYDLIILDPPAYAKHLNARHKAVLGYKRLNATALKHIDSGGILFTFSCSAVVSRQLFYDTITAAAIEAQRKVRVLHHLYQPPDHPVSIFHPEGEYLKGLVLYCE